MFQTCAVFCTAPCPAPFAYPFSFLLLCSAFALPFTFFCLSLLSDVCCLCPAFIFSTLLAFLLLFSRRRRLDTNSSSELHQHSSSSDFSKPAFDSDEDDDTCCLNDAPPFAKAQRCLCSLASKGASKSESESCSDDCDALVLRRYLLAARLRFLDIRSLSRRGMFMVYSISKTRFFASL